MPHVLKLGGSDANDGLFTTNGSITVEALGDIDAERAAANGAVSISGCQVNVKSVSGSPVVYNGTTVLNDDQTTSGQPILFNGNVRLLRDLTFDSNGGDITITGRVLSTDGTQGLTLIADGGSVLVGGGDAEFLDVQGAHDFTLGGALHTAGDFSVEADTVALNAPRRSITTTSGALRLEPRSDTAAMDVGREGSGFSLNDAELLGNG